MATHFSANQYENAFSPKHLQNYEVSNHFKQNPSAKKGCTRPISNDRGHILPGIPRSTESPWGNFKNNWDDEMDCKNTKHSQNLTTLKSEKASSMRNSTFGKEKSSPEAETSGDVCAATETNGNEVKEKEVTPRKETSGSGAKEKVVTPCKESNSAKEKVVTPRKEINSPKEKVITPCKETNGNSANEKIVTPSKEDTQRVVTPCKEDTQPVSEVTKAATPESKSKEVIEA